MTTDFFCAVTGGEITAYNLVRPRAWGNTWFAPDASDADYRGAGLWPVVPEYPPLADGEQLAGPTYVVDVGTQVVRAVHTAVPIPPPPVPRVVTNFQARAALMQADLFETVNAAVMGGSDALAKQAWEYANEITRDGALVNSLATGLGLTSAQLDDLFRAASVVEA
jgi:hypothetical protein